MFLIKWPNWSFTRIINIITCFDVLYSGIGCITWSYLALYFLKVIYTHHFCLYLAFFLFPLLINLLFFESFSFSYTTRTPCHSGGTTSSLYLISLLPHWGQCWSWLGGVVPLPGPKFRKEVLLIMLGYFVNLLLFA